MTPPLVQLPYRTRLYDNLATFSGEELEDLGFRLGISQQLSQNASPRDLARQIVGLCASQGRLDDLVAQARQDHEHLDWRPSEPAPAGRPRRRRAWAAAAILIVLAGIGLYLAARPVVPTLTATPTPAMFLYAVQVTSTGGESIPRARVTLELPGAAPASQLTDGDGLAVLHVASPLAGRIARLIVDAEGYQQNVQTLQLEAGAPARKVKLDRQP